MAHDTSIGSVWVLDTSSATLITKNPVKISHIVVTWKVSSAGTLQLGETFNEGTGATRTILTAKSRGASTAGQDSLTESIPMFDYMFQNLTLVTATNLDSCYIYTR